MKKFKISCFVFFAVFYVNLFAGPKFQFNCDYAVFKTSNDFVLEIYASFFAGGLNYIYNNNNFEGGALLDVKLFDKKTEKFVHSTINFTPSKTNDTSSSNLKNRIVIQKNILVQEGEYILSVYGKDYIDTLSYDSLIKNIKISANNNKPYISDIELSSSIFKSTDKQSNFFKWSLEVIPNPSNLFGNNINRLFYFYEIYNIYQDIISEKFFLEVALINQDKNIVDKKHKKVNTVSLLMIDYDSFLLDSLPTGKYIISVSISDSVKNLFLSSTKDFIVYNSNIVENLTGNPEMDYLKSEYGVMKEELLDDEFNKCIYIRKDEEGNQYEKLKTVEEKRKFMYNFWKNRENPYSSTKNEFKIQYFTKIKESNILFKEPFREGWKTDRGRIYITYGKPDDVEKYPFEAETKSYEIWKYNSIDGGSECAFIESQFNGSGIFILVHSTIRKELRDDNWKAKLKK
jgi:GWxTD domain-containing protein